MVWRQRLQQIGTESQFRLRYKIRSGRFKEIADTIRHDVQASNARKAMASSGGIISAELRLSMALRYIAGGHYVDIADMHGVSTQEVHKSLKLVSRAINKHYTALHMSMPRPDDTEALERLAVVFFDDNGQVR
jgi:DNA-directed RNA polymerase specialized sigma24 family protein